MKFLVQDIPIPWDFVMELYRSQEFYNWKGESLEISKYGRPLLHNPREYCPVGSVEFVVDWYKNIWGKSPKPINCPDIFSKQIHLPTPLIPSDEIRKSFPGITEVFIKSERVIKSEINGKYSVFDKKLEDPFSDPVVIRPWIDDIISEWRLFVKEDKILDVKNYSGDPFCCPKKYDCEYLVKQYYLLTSIPAFTLDIGIRKSGEYCVLEIHDFFSCGTYGFSDYQRYPIMLWRWFKWFTEND